jgi:hypothetical protein
MQDDDVTDNEIWSLSGDATGEGGLVQILDRSDYRLRAHHLCINARMVTAVDTVFGAGVRRCIEAALRRPQSKVTIWPPAEPGSLLDRMHDLLAVLPDRARWSPAPDASPAVRDRTIIIPATPIETEEDAELYGEAVGRALTRGNVPPVPVRRTAQAIAELTGNAVTASVSAGLPPILSVALDPRAESIGVTVITDPPLLASPEDAPDELRRLVEFSRAHRGGWHRLASKRGASLLIALSTARATMRLEGDEYRVTGAVDALAVSWTMQVWGQ